MKKLKSIIVIILINILFSFVISACKNRPNEAAINQPIEQIDTHQISETEENTEEISYTLKNQDAVDNVIEMEIKGNNYIICIDAGHQSLGDNKKEPNGPGSAEMKARVTGGTRGVNTGVSEYQLNLDVSLKLKGELEKRGYTVIMTRTTNDVNISNMERAIFANDNNADICIRIHANGASNSSINGATAVTPSAENKYVSDLYAKSLRLSKNVLNAYCKSTGFKQQNIIMSDTMTGINWCNMPVTILEMGYMTNPDEDKKMQEEDIQYAMVSGIADGIDKYFEE